MTSSNIALITTGGTIGSSTESDSVNVSQGQQTLRDHIEQLCQRKSITLTTQAAFNKNSEDLTPSDWLTVIETVEEAVTSGIDKIIITHGTDTMAYTAAAVALYCHQHPIKIIFTGSFYPLDHPESDVTTNLLGAFATITESKIPNGVYVSWADQEKKIHVIDALNLKPMAFDEQTFKASFNQLIGTFKTADSLFEAHTSAHHTKPIAMPLKRSAINQKMLNRSGERVYQFVSYPGMNLMQLCSGLATGSCVIINLYHSGTAPSQQGNGGLLEAIKSFPELTFLLTPLPSTYISTPYASTVALLQSGAVLFQDLQPHLLYVILTLGLSEGLNTLDILTHLNSHQLLLPTP